MDELGERLHRAATEIQAAVGDQAGEISLEGTYSDEVTIAGDRVGFAHLALRSLHAAIPSEASSETIGIDLDDRKFSSPIADYRRQDAMGASQPMSLKDRLLGLGCVLFVLFAFVAFLRGCAALETDIQKWLR